MMGLALSATEDARCYGAAPGMPNSRCKVPFSAQLMSNFGDSESQYLSKCPHLCLCSYRIVFLSPRSHGGEIVGPEQLLVQSAIFIVNMREQAGSRMRRQRVDDHIPSVEERSGSDANSSRRVAPLRDRIPVVLGDFPSER